MTPDTITVEMRGQLATELGEVLAAEVAHVDEYHSTEQVMKEASELLADSDGTVEMRGELARELANVLELEVEQAEEFHSTEQTMQEGAERLRAALN